MRAATLRLALGAIALALLAWPGAAAALPGQELGPIRGVAYQPAPSDYRVCDDGSCPYFDTDFFNRDFKQLWGPADGGRDDLAKMADDLGANLLRLYNWNPARDHLGFLNYAHRKGLRVAVPISNYFVEWDKNAAANIEALVRGVYVDEHGNPSTVPHPAVSIWTVGNEFDLQARPQSTEGRRAKAAEVARATALLVAAENKVGATVRLPVSVPVSFAEFDNQPPAISATRMAIEAMRAPASGLSRDFVANRFVAAVNSFNPGAFLHQWLTEFSSLVPHTAVWFSELGINLGGSCNGFPPPCDTSESQQAAYIAGQWAEAPPGTPDVYLGAAAFEFSNEPWKQREEGTFGLTKFAPGIQPRRVPTAGGTYLVDQLVDKPSWGALRDAFQPRMLLSGGGRLGDGPRARLSGAPRAGQVGGLRIRRNDVVLLDRGSGRARRILDGARAGLAGNAIDAFTYDRRGKDLLITLARPQRLPGVGRAGATDVLRFSPRTGRFELALRGARVGLRGPSRDIRALALTPSHRLVIATRGAWRRGGLAVGPHDLLVLGPPRPGKRGVARWRPYLRGAAAGLTRPGERIDSAWVDPWSGAIYLGTTGRFAAGGVRGDDDDAVVCDRRRRGGCDLRLGWRANRYGLRSTDLSGFALVRAALSR